MRQDAEKLVSTYSDLVVRLSWQYLGIRDDALDVCQDVLLKLLLREKPFADAEHEKAWVVRVTINACKNVLGSSARTRSVALDVETLPDAGDASADGFMQGEVLEAVQALPENQREAVYLHYYEGYRIEEIARMANRSYAAVAKDLSRAREKLRGMLEV